MLREFTHGDSETLLKVVDVGKVDRRTAFEDLDTGNLCNLCTRDGGGQWNRKAPKPLTAILLVL